MEKATSYLEITIISAEGLRLDGRFVRKNIFVIVRADSRDQRSTSLEKGEEGSNPSWNQKLEPPLPLPNSVQSSITVEVQCKKSSGGVKTIGTSKIPISDFMGDYTPPQYLHFLSYRLRDRNGERNGIINFSVRTLGSQSAFAAWPVKPPQPLGFAASMNQKLNAASGSGNGSGIALGVPVPVPYNYGYGNRHGDGHDGHGYGV